MEVRLINSSCVTVLSNSLEETENLGYFIGSKLKCGDVIGLSGKLGAGKTELIRGISRFFKVQESVYSPTFVLEVVYEGFFQTNCKPIKLHHWDLYRITSGEIDCELFDLFNFKNDIALIEWHEKVPIVEKNLSLEILINFVDLCSSSFDSLSDLFQDNCKREIIIKDKSSSRICSAIAEVVSNF